MNIGYFLFGTVILVITIIDILWTTLWVEGGAGPLTARLMTMTWQTVRWIGQNSPRLLTLSGPLILILSLTSWIVLLWAGWTLVIASADMALIDTLGRGRASWFDQIYFTGYTLFTLGTGDFVPRHGIWQLITILISATGLFFVTLVVTYILSLLGAVTQKHSFASTISGLGTESTDIVRTGWNGEEFDGLKEAVRSLATQLDTLTSNHKAYPIMHYFHSQETQQAPATSIPIFDDALTLLRFGVVEEARPPNIVLRAARTSVENYLGTLHKTFVEPADRTPPPPQLTPLRTAGIPTVSDAEFTEAIADLEDRRRLLLGLVESDAWQWPNSITER